MNRGLHVSLADGVYKGTAGGHCLLVQGQSYWLNEPIKLSNTPVVVHVSNSKAMIIEEPAVAVYELRTQVTEKREAIRKLHEEIEALNNDIKKILDL